MFWLSTFSYLPQVFFPKRLFWQRPSAYYSLARCPPSLRLSIFFSRSSSDHLPSHPYSGFSGIRMASFHIAVRRTVLFFHFPSESHATSCGRLYARYWLTERKLDYLALRYLLHDPFKFIRCILQSNLYGKLVIHSSKIYHSLLFANLVFCFQISFAEYSSR